MSRPLRIGVAGFLHESNTYLGVPTQYADFVAASLTTGPSLLDRWRGTHHELGGFLAVLERENVEIVPLLATFAIPSGCIDTASFERIAAELLEQLRLALPIDGLLLALHGATVGEEHPDADGEILQRIRGVVGDALPIVTTLDLHANVSPRMIALANSTIAYRTNPHLDQRARGEEAGDLLLRTLRGEVNPVQSLETPPMLIQISKQHTASEPAKLLYDDLAHVLTWPGILTASIAMGFYYADVPEMGASVFATADGDSGLARRAARYLANCAWKRRAELTGNLPAPADAVAAAIAAPHGPVVLMDVGDNVGAGSPANSTLLLQEILRQNGRDALVILCDPMNVAVCLAKGPGESVRLEVGDPALSIKGVIRTLSDGRFVEREIRHGGWGEFDQGLTAVIETNQGHSIVLTSRRMAPMSLEQILSLGIRPERKKVLIVKGVVAPRAAYAPVAAEIVLVDTPGVTSDNPRHFEYRQRRRPLYPLEPDAVYEPGSET
jgi:microcystin degradation protein MlrC